MLSMIKQKRSQRWCKKSVRNTRSKQPLWAWATTLAIDGDLLRLVQWGEDLAQCVPNGCNTKTDDNVYGAVIMARSLREFTRFIWWMHTEWQMAANPQTMPTDLGCESVGRLLPSTSTITIY